MNPDDFQQAWQTQSSRPRLTIDADLLLKEVQRNQQQFDAVIFFRDVREVGVGLLMVPVWIWMGVQLGLPWTWYLTVPGLLWIAAFLPVDRMRHKRRIPSPGESLRQCVEGSLAEVDHQIWLLRNVFWWYLLPLGLPILAFFCQVGWSVRAGGWWAVLAVLALSTVPGVVFAGVYKLNQDAVRTSLLPRRQELHALLTSLNDDTPATS